MMPVEKLPLASWRTTLGLGFLSAVFDNIPLTALALKQNGYDWACWRMRWGLVAR
jgi:Na+/H+ antiporter NhaD/arsenite permease-like protein